MSGTTEEKKSIFTRAYNWLKLKAIAFKDAVVGAFVSIKNWFKSLSLFKTEPLACCTGGEPVGEKDTAAPQQPEGSVVVTLPANSGEIGAAASTVDASAKVDSVPATAMTLTADALTAHNEGQPQTKEGTPSAANDEGKAPSSVAGSTKSSLRKAGH